MGELMDAGVIFPITEVKAQYKNSCTFDDDFEVQVKMTAFNKAKMEFDYKIIRLEPRWFDKIQKVYAAEKAAEE